MYESFKKRWVLLVIVFILAVALVGCQGSSSSSSKNPVSAPAQQVNTTANNGTAAPAAQEPQDNVPREYRNALRAAQQYVDIMPFSERGLFEQLTSEYGEGYPEDAARYAIENVKVDWYQEALEAAMTYLEIMPMSDKELFEQLTSEYGEKFTEDQARYAINNLPD